MEWCFGCPHVETNCRCDCEYCVPPKSACRKKVVEAEQYEERRKSAHAMTLKLQARDRKNRNENLG